MGGRQKKGERHTKKKKKKTHFPSFETPREGSEVRREGFLGTSISSVKILLEREKEEGGPV